MIEHKVTEHIVNAGFQRSATLSCSCGLSIDVANIRKLPLSAARRQLEGMHKNLKAEVREKTDRKITTNPVLTPAELRDLNKPKKSKKRQPVEETEPEQPTEPDLKLDEDWSDEGDSKS